MPLKLRAAALAAVLFAIAGLLAFTIAVEPRLAAQNVAPPAAAKDAAPGSLRKVLYYRNPMGLADTSPVPKKDSMGMAYIPVYKDDEGDGPAIKISPGKLQAIGVTSEAASRRVLTSTFHAPGVIQIDERRKSVIALRFDAFIEKVANVTTGSIVHKGEPLMRLYSPTLSAAAAQYAADLAIRDRSLPPGSLQKLQNLGVPESLIKSVERGKQGFLSVEWPVPFDGIVTERKAIEGMEAKTGDVLFQLADISEIWALADISERDLSLIKAGDTATVRPRGYPGKSFTGKITVVYPEIDRATRTAKVRIELANPGDVLLPGMYADVDIAIGRDTPVLTVPESAVIDSGERKLVLLDKGGGRFEPRPVETGREGGGYVEIRDGIQENDKVVDSANFLIDAESNLTSALKSLAQGDAQ